MTDVGTPADLVPLKEPLVEAVIDAYMAHKVTEGSDFEFYEGGCSPSTVWTSRPASH